MTCQDCVHYEVCVFRASQFKSVGVEVDWDEENYADICMMSREKSRFVELPCEVGQTVYVIVGETIKKRTVEQIFIGKDESESFVYAATISGGVLDYMFYEFGWYVFLSREEAEKALSERSK